MTNSHVALLAFGAALTGAWLSSAAGTAPQAPAVPQASAPSAAQPAAVEPQSRLDLESEVTRLAARLEAAPRPTSPVRNPFTLARRLRTEMSPTEASGGGLLQSEADQVPLAVVGWAVADTPHITLAGVGAERTPNGRVHTAILSADGRVFLSRVGDEVMGRYQVREVTAAAATLLDLETRETLHLALP
jgi:hypothetical protein